MRVRSRCWPRQSGRLPDGQAEPTAPLSTGVCQNPNVYPVTKADASMSERKPVAVAALAFGGGVLIVLNARDRAGKRADR